MGQNEISKENHCGIVAIDETKSSFWITALYLSNSFFRRFNSMNWVYVMQENELKIKLHLFQKQTKKSTLTND